MRREDHFRIRCAAPGSPSAGEHTSNKELFCMYSVFNSDKVLVLFLIARYYHSL